MKAKTVKAKPAKLTKEQKDEYRLRRFVEKTSAEAKRQFSSDGKCYLDIYVCDTRKHQPPAGNLPIPRLDLLKSDKEWRDAISFLLCNASTALEVLNSTFKTYENSKNYEDNRMALGVELASLQDKLKVNIVYAPLGIYPRLPLGMKWEGINQKTYACLGMVCCETGGLWPHCRERVLEFISIAIAKLAKQAGSNADTFLVTLRDGAAHVYVAVAKPEEFHDFDAKAGRLVGG